MGRRWQRMIVLIDMNAFFASVEQLDHPLWRGRPVGVSNGLRGSCIITCSYEARAFGIKTGMRLPEARQLCPSLIQAPSRPARYAAVSTRIMEALKTLTPDIEIFSIDEAFLDVTHCQRLHGSPQAIGRLVKQTVFQASGICCSVGISGDKTTAKYAAKCQKPDGLTIIPPWEARHRLHNVPVTQLCGIAKGIGNFLAQYGAKTCGDVAKLPVSILAKRFGNPGRRIWYMCQGQDPQPLQLAIKVPKSMGHGKVMPPNTRDQTTILTYFLHMAEKLAARLRRNKMEAQTFFIGLKSREQGWVGHKYRHAYPTQHSQIIFHYCKHLLANSCQGQGFWQVQITALDPRAETMQLDLFYQPDSKLQHLQQVQDHINQRYGELNLAPARLINRSDMPNVIAPAWQPDGHRQTIDPREK